VSKKIKSQNHRYSDMIHRLGRFLKNKIGYSTYTQIALVFGLPAVSTVTGTFSSDKPNYGALDLKEFEKAATRNLDRPCGSAVNDARCLR